ncbi:DUF397 domain-containing protein [Streptomyces gelaticus]|uniref:DUF397 domain-containing protein n=1 Tax=Streptomyces gelaticus TaxID=285446 RepID=UPI0037A6D0E4
MRPDITRTHVDHEPRPTGWAPRSQPAPTAPEVPQRVLDAQPLGVVPVRDSKSPSGPVLNASPTAFAAFVAGVKDGEFGAA